MSDLSGYHDFHLSLKINWLNSPLLSDDAAPWRATAKGAPRQQAPGSPLFIPVEPYRLS